MSEYLFTILLIAIAFSAGYGFCAFFMGGKIEQAYEDGLADGSGLKKMQEDQWQ